MDSVRKEHRNGKQAVRLSAEALVGMVLLGPLHRALLVGPDSIQIELSLEFGINLLLAKSTTQP